MNEYCDIERSYVNSKHASLSIHMHNGKQIVTLVVYIDFDVLAIAVLVLIMSDTRTLPINVIQFFDSMRKPTMSLFNREHV
jgi:hypothetical protein